MNNTVRISGAVLSPNTVCFENDKYLSYFLNQAGGVSRKGKILSGCEIVVPFREKREINPQAGSVGLPSASVLSFIAAVIASIFK